MTAIATAAVTPARAVSGGPDRGDVSDWLLAAFSAFTILYDAALVLSWSLGAIMVVWGLCVLAAAVLGRARLRAWVHMCREGLRDPDRAGLLALACGTGLVCLLVSKPNDDDSFYLSRAVLAWEAMWRPILVDFPFVFTNGAGGIFTSLPAFEHLLAGLAGFASVHPMDVYHLASPAFCGFLLPYAWALALRRLGLTRRGALLGSLAIVMLMLLDGTTIRGVANFSLFRLWQGKVVLVSVLTPLAFRAALDAVDWPGPRAWTRSLLLGVAGIGLSTTAAFFLPVLVGVAGFAWWLTRPRRAALWRAPVAALMVFAYPALCILPIYRSVHGVTQVFASPFAFGLWDTLMLVYGAQINPTLISALAALSGLLLMRRFRLALWAVIATAAIALPLAWSPSADLIVRYATSPDALWRLAYATPILLLVGLGAGGFADAPR